jgi:PAS domain-containing protein
MKQLKSHTRQSDANAEDRLPCRPDRKRALSVSEARYRTMVETMGDGLSEIDEHQNTTYANDTLKTGYHSQGRESSNLSGRREPVGQRGVIIHACQEEEIFRVCFPVPCSKQGGMGKKRMATGPGLERRGIRHIDRAH